MTRISIKEATTAKVLRDYFRWNNVKIAGLLKVSEGTVRNIFKDQERAEGPRTRERNVDEIAERRAVIEEIVLKEVVEMVKEERSKPAPSSQH